jgi:hypothetical protein
MTYFGENVAADLDELIVVERNEDVGNDLWVVSD